MSCCGGYEPVPAIARECTEIFCDSSLDTSWKIDAEGDFGACRGMWDKDRRPKYGRHKQN